MADFVDKLAALRAQTPSAERRRVLGAAVSGVHFTGQLALEEAKALGMSLEVAEAVGRLWETVMREMGPDSDFTSAIKPIEKAAGVVVGGTKGGATGK